MVGHDPLPASASRFTVEANTAPSNCTVPIEGYLISRYALQVGWNPQYIVVVNDTGFEPVAFRTSSGCSPTELIVLVMG